MVEVPKLPTLDGQPLGEDKVKVLSSVPDDVLRRMNHAEWLGDFAKVIGTTRPGGPPMTVFRQGATERLRLAERYIRLLEKELHWAKKGKFDGEQDDAEGR
jgi:hypothetical protein